MIIPNIHFGRDILSDHQSLEIHLAGSGKNGLKSFIGACIEEGWDYEDAIQAKSQQICGPLYDDDILALLDLHASPLSRPQLWIQDQKGYYSLVYREWQKIGALDACCSNSALH